MRAGQDAPSLADVVVSSCYKWLLGVHGAAVFYVNRDRFSDFEPPFLGWNSPSRHGGWERPTEFRLQDTLHCFQPGNAGFISLYILDNALTRLLDIAINALNLSDAFLRVLAQRLVPRLCGLP